MIFNGKEYRAYDEFYFVSQDGEIYSVYKKGLLKQAIDLDGYPRVDIHSRHMKVHRLVYQVWNGEIPSGMQVNHIDDNKLNSSASNLYLGTQKDNIADCINNGHRVGFVKSVAVYDKALGVEILFPSVKEFLKYTGHSVKNGSLTHCLDKKWFQERFSVIKQKSVSTIESYKSIRAAYDSGVEDKAG